MTATSSSTAPIVPPKLYRIGEIVRHTGLSRQTIHNYTVLGLISETDWTPGGHRLYEESVFFRLQRVAELKSRRSIAEIKRILDSDSA